MQEAELQPCGPVTGSVASPVGLLGASLHLPPEQDTEQKEAWVL